MDMIEDNPQPADKEKLIARVSEMLRNGRAMVLGVLSEDQRLVISSMGLDPKRIPEVLRHFAEHVEREEHQQRVAEAIQAVPPDRKAECPGCSQNVFVTTPIPPRMLRGDEGTRAICVCTCGAFLVPYLGDERLQLRFMTEEEIVDLPDEIRNRIVRARREFERLRAQHEQE
jgi:hypothetical protein